MAGLTTAVARRVLRRALAPFVRATTVTARLVGVGLCTVMLTLVNCVYLHLPHLEKAVLARSNRFVFAANGEDRVNGDPLCLL